MMLFQIICFMALALIDVKTYGQIPAKKGFQKHFQTVPLKRMDIQFIRETMNLLLLSKLKMSQ